MSSCFVENFRSAMPHVITVLRVRTVLDWLAFANCLSAWLRLPVP